jgi:hypothetical protein
MNMNKLNTLVITLAVLTGTGMGTASAETIIDMADVNNSLNARVQARSNALDHKLNAKVSALVDTILKGGRGRQERAVETGPYSMVVYPIVENSEAVYELERNQS